MTARKEPVARKGRARRPGGTSPPNTRPATVEQYLEAQPPAMRKELQRIRRVVLAAAPGLREVISYRLAAVRTDRGLLVCYGGYADHGSFFPGALSRYPELARAMAPYVSSKGTLRFTLDRPLPARLITRIVQARLRQQTRSAR